MSVKTAKTIQTVLLVIAVIAFIVGFVLSISAGKKRDHDPEDITITLEDVRTEQKNSRDYYLYFDYKFTNGTKGKLETMKVVTRFYDKNGDMVLELTTNFSGMEVDSGETTKETSSLRDMPTLDEGFAALYNGNLKDFTYTHEITYTYFEDGYFYSADD